MCIRDSPKSERTTVLLGDELPEYRMPGFCIMTKRYLCLLYTSRCV